ncbi:type II toxin-antitoxin system VapC family toxin [Luteococcus sp. H138]|uniref:type II toxin-antitoxin system VapC family toxin n=1 Tax=unclassified Luteococcus TaxID=2639923 RepID=UPI00313BC1B2
MIVLDTNVVSELFRSHPDASVVEWLTSLPGEVAVTAVTVAELLAGVRQMPDGRRKMALAEGIDAVLQPYRDDGLVLAFDDAAARQYATVLAERALLGLPISTAVAQIAATCRSHAATLDTRNQKDFRHTGIDLVNPWLG